MEKRSPVKIMERTHGEAGTNRSKSASVGGTPLSLEDALRLVEGYD
jgi:hypothetical protein